MPRRFVDLSIHFENETPSDPSAFASKIVYVDQRLAAPAA
jgi:hypothetical protein